MTTTQNKSIIPSDNKFALISVYTKVEINLAYLQSIQNNSTQTSFNKSQLTIIIQSTKQQLATLEQLINVMD